MLGVLWALLVADRIVLLRVSGPARVGVDSCMLEEERESKTASEKRADDFFRDF